MTEHTPRSSQSSQDSPSDRQHPPKSASGTSRDRQSSQDAEWARRLKKAQNWQPPLRVSTSSSIASRRYPAHNAPDGREIYEGQRKLDLARAALRTLEAQDIFQQRMLEEQRLLIKALEYEADDTHPLRSTPSIIKDREYLQRRIEEEHLVLRSLEEEAEDIRAGWEEGLAQLGYVRRSLIARGIPIHPVDSGQKQRQNSFDGTSEDTSEDELHPFERPSPSPPQFRSPSPSASVPRSNHSLDFSENQSWPTTSERESEGVGNAFSPLY